MNFIQSNSKQQGSIAINLDNVSAIKFSKKTCDYNPLIRFEFEKGNCQIWEYPDEDAFQKDIKMLEKKLNIPRSEKMSINVAEDDNDDNEPQDLSGVFF